MGIQTTVNNKEVIENNEVVYLSVKPYIVPEILDEIKEIVTKKNLIVSIAAGITTQTIETVSFFLYFFVFVYSGIGIKKTAIIPSFEFLK